MHSALLKPYHPSVAPIEIRPRGRGVAADPVPRHLNEGQPLFHERDTARYVYQITSGAVRLTRVQKDGRRQVTAFGFPGDLVGLPDQGLHTTECEAIAPCELMAHRFDGMTDPDRNPGLHRLVMTAALHEIRVLQNHFLLLGKRLAIEKTAAFLALVLDRASEPLGDYRVIRLPMNRADIADYLGLTPETVSRAFTELRMRRIILLDDANTVIVRSPQGLRDLADGDATG